MTMPASPLLLWAAVRCGFGLSAVLPGHLGIGMIRERAEAAGATVRVVSRIG
jgi:signal transduction histidine kinase